MTIYSEQRMLDLLRKNSFLNELHEEGLSLKSIYKQYVEMDYNIEAEYEEG